MGRVPQAPAGRRAQIGQLGWTGDNGDPDNFFFLLGCRGGSRPRTTCPNGATRTSTTCSRRPARSPIRPSAPSSTRMQVIAHEEAPELHIAHSIVFEPIRKNVTGYKVSPLGRTTSTASTSSKAGSGPRRADAGGALRLRIGHARLLPSPRRADPPDLSRVDLPDFRRHPSRAGRPGRGAGPASAASRPSASPSSATSWGSTSRSGSSSSTMSGGSPTAISASRCRRSRRC